MAPSCRLYLQVPSFASSRIETNLQHAITHYDVACALLLPQDGSQLVADAVDMKWAAKLKSLCQTRDVAFLIQDNAETAKAVGADGVHILADPAAYNHARQLLGADAIVGAFCATSRHDAMVLAERGSDYVAFGNGMQSMEPSDEFPADLLSWWSEVFQIPCVAWDIGDRQHAEVAMKSGADFLSLTEKCLDDPDYPARLAGIAAILESSR